MFSPHMFSRRAGEPLAAGVPLQVQLLDLDPAQVVAMSLPPFLDARNAFLAAYAACLTALMPLATEAAGD